MTTKRRLAAVLLVLLVGCGGAGDPLPGGSSSQPGGSSGTTPDTGPLISAGAYTGLVTETVSGATVLQVGEAQTTQLSITESFGPSGVPIWPDGSNQEIVIGQTYEIAAGADGIVLKQPISINAANNTLTVIYDIQWISQIGLDTIILNGRRVDNFKRLSEKSIEYNSEEFVKDAASLVFVETKISGVLTK